MLIVEGINIIIIIIKAYKLFMFENQKEIFRKKIIMRYSLLEDTWQYNVIVSYHNKKIKRPFRIWAWLKEIDNQYL